jgi:hypothetical protein
MVSQVFFPDLPNCHILLKTLKFLITLKRRIMRNACISGPGLNGLRMGSKWQRYRDYDK